MINQNIEFHNVVEMHKREHLNGLQLERIPFKIHKHLSERGRWNAQTGPGTEIRCVTESDHVRLFLSTLQGDGPLLVFKGDFHHSTHRITPGKIHCLHLTSPQGWEAIKPEALRGWRFSPNVWRFFMAGFFPIFHELETFSHDVRPPNADEKPKVRWLSYGSSISAGCGSSSPHLTYVQQAAWRLGVDVYNLAQGGACMCEPQLADFFATRGDWEFASLEIGINMLGQFTTPQFKERASYLIQTILDKNPGKPVVVITPYPNQHHYKIDETDISRRQRDYTAFLKEFVDDSNNENLHIIDGFDILTDFCGHNIDLVHPFDTGMTQMGENLAKALANIHGIKALLDDLK